MTTNKAVPPKKANTLTASNWLKSIQKQNDSLEFRTNAQQIFQQIRQQPSIEQQQNDLRENFELLSQRPLIRLQTQRLFHDYVQQQQNLEQTFSSFQTIWNEQLVIHSNTLKQIDPNYISPRFANADTSRYKQYLIQLMFILLSINPVEINAPQYLANFVEWMNGIAQAKTTAKVTLRIKPDIQSDMLIELPKHAIVNVYSDENTLWKKIRFSNDNQESFGYVMSAYLKF